MHEKINELLSQLTIEEKVSLLAGATWWHTAAIERLGIPALKMTDGPNGARGEESFTGTITAACFPVGIALAAAWNPALVESVGRALAEEAKSKGAQVLLAPTVNIHHSPLNGRNFECYSEDPYLTARMGVAYIKGVQSQQVSATIKHYVGNESEYHRHNMSSEISERALREIYLPPFKAAVQEAEVWAVMGAYNRVNGTFACENSYTLQDILRKEWGFTGLVMSDWWGTMSTADALNHGLDLEMPAPPLWRGEKLLKAFQAGEIDETALNDSVRHLLELLIKVGQFEHPEIPQEQAIDKPEHRALARQAAAEGIVLLKNDGGVLPLQPEKLTSLAIIGPNAKTARIMAGGSAYFVGPHYAVSPYDGIVDKLGASVDIGYEIGCTNHRLLPILDPTWVTLAHGEAEHGFTVEYFNNGDLAGEPVKTTVFKSSEPFWPGEFSPEVNAGMFSARFTGALRVPETGRYTLGLSSVGLCRLSLNNTLLIDNWTMPISADEKTHEIELVAGEAYAVQVDFSKKEALLRPSFHLGCLPPIPQDSIMRAAKLAAESDVALVFVGLSHEWESERYDRQDMELVGGQVALIEQVAAANPKTVVVLNTGSPISMNWLDQAAAVVQAWYPGQECGNAIADVLFGDVNPSGKLTQTFPKRLEDNPAYINYPGENGKVHYGEGIFVGYRYYEKKKIAPLFPFGYGLSYTTFAYTNLQLSSAVMAPEDEIQVSVDVQNTGTRAGQEVVQLYVRDVNSTLARPEKELKGFAKVTLLPGESKTVTLTLNRESLAYYDDALRQWVAEAGEFDALVGSSSQDIRGTARLTLTASSRFGASASSEPRFTVRLTPIRQLIAYEPARTLLGKHLPEFMNSPYAAGLTLELSVEQMSRFAPDLFTDEVKQTLAREFAQL